MSEKEDFPSFFEQAKNFGKAVGRHASQGFAKVSSKEYIDRLNICKTCDKHRDGKYIECGCFLRTKAWWKSEDCPLGKWEKQK